MLKQQFLNKASLTSAVTSPKSGDPVASTKLTATSPLQALLPWLGTWNHECSEPPRNTATPATTFIPICIT